MSFEESLLNGIPLDEAAGFFLRIRGKDKAATAMPGAGGAGAMAALPATAKGQQMPAPQMPALPATAMGQNTSPGMKMAAAKSPQEAGEARARGNFAAGAEKDRLTRGERRGRGVGRLVGGAAGALTGQTPGSALGLGLLGGYLGGKAGGSLGHGADVRRFKKLPREGAAVEEKSASAFGEGMAFIPEMIRAAVGEVARNTQGDRVKGLGLLAGGAIPLAAMAGAGFAMGRFTGTPKDKAASAFKLALEQTGLAPQGVVPQLDPETQQLLAIQQEGDQAAEQGESQYLRQQLEALRQESAAAVEQAQTLESQQAQADATTAQMQTQVADATQKAMDAQDQVLQQQQAAAAMRMAFQELRGQLLEAASAEPPSLTPSIGSQAQAAQAASQAAGASSAPSPTAGPAGQAPNPGVPPAGMAPTGDDTVSTPAEKNEPMFEGASSTTSMNQKEPSGDAKIPGKEVLASSRPLVRR